MTTAVSLPVPENWINDRFGSKRGLLNYSLFEAKRIAGVYSPLKVKKHAKPERLVFVCVGNICRSPLAEAVAKSKGYNAISYGLKTRGNDNADSRAIQIAKEFDLDISEHRTRKISDYNAQQGDLIIGMEPKHLEMISQWCPKANVTLLGMYGNHSRIYIHDPFNTNFNFFNRCEQRVIKYTKALVDYVQ